LSTDETKEYLKTLMSPFNWLHEKDLGIYDAMNKGVERATGDWLYFLGADDKLYDSNTLSNVVGEIGKKKEVDLILGKIQYSLEGGESYFLKKNNGIITSSLSRKMWIHNTIHHQAILYKKEIFTENKYSLKYKILSDYNLNLNLLIKGVNKMEINDIIAICRADGESKNFGWELYKEEINLKTQNSSVVFRPLFYMVGIYKFLIKKRF